MSTEPASSSLSRWMARLRWLLVVLSATLCAFSWWSFAQADPQAATEPRFYCPMHPQVKSHDPGECPICHMTLEPIPRQPKKKRPAPAPAAASAAPGSPALPPDVPPTLELSLDRVQAINVRTRAARRLPASGKLTLPAVVEAQERGRAEVHARASGFVERVSVRETGARVKAGQELFALYSPEIYQAAAELSALKKLGDAGDNVERARHKLELFGVSAALADKLTASAGVSRTIPVSAPISGYVARLNVVQGAFVSPDATLYEIVDPSRVYVVASLPESRSNEVTLGQAARYLMGDDLSVPGKIDLIYPELDRSARSVKLRLSLDNPEGRISPGQFGRVELALAAEPAVAVPRDAVIDTGRGAYAFVAQGDGHFRAAAVELGAVLPGDEIEIRRGIKDGENIVAGAAFLLDSESRLRASLAPTDE
ncbi:MAG TPA: efflux RND transporter periplasmic adaptor subunit [Polyangiaceae bacterium]|nr:efflux RND transporter periplasmic adaptor subunit [Polyangiaceae bacterium]